LILGICNGFQVLVKTGLLPGTNDSGPAISTTLTWNDSHRYEDRWVHLSVDKSRSLFSPKGKSILHLPVAHGEGRFTTTSQEDIDALKMREQIVFRYVNADGSKPSYPANPNGSLGDIAGICDGTGQVLGLMPHPERALFPWHHPDWSRRLRSVGDGASLFDAAVAAMK
jgi:phosphoribosylformylglycinamidine synthase